MSSFTSTDPIRLYLQDIGRVAMLSPEEELTLARLVQQRERLQASRPADGDRLAWARASGLSPAALRQALHRGERARDRMIQANLRLVVAVARKHQRRGLELLDLVQEGTLGLERAVERFDPSRGFRFSTYAYWWIRQGITRAIACQSRTIRLPVHINEKLARIRRVQRQLSARLGRSPLLSELAAATGLREATLRLILESQPRPVSLDRRFGRDQDTDLGQLLEDGHATPEQELERRELHDCLEALLDELSSREAEVIRQRYGLEDDRPRTLSEIGSRLRLSRERVRQIESCALHKLRQPCCRARVRDHLIGLG
ncbi:MAG: RNA polymerase sigma factor, RpoD/SigA family [Synechococcaceae cyanobacterium]|nr:RNA polymerase sigma factor, RpoD/SigA family [Synechococcaceae cyanobacterium]